MSVLEVRKKKNSSGILKQQMLVATIKTKDKKFSRTLIGTIYPELAIAQTNSGAIRRT